jgi:hypothetical protein
MQQGTDLETVEVRLYRRHCRLAEWHARRGTLQRLNWYSRPSAPSLPTSLALTENDLLERLREARDGNGKKAEDRELLAAFGRWRCGVMASEARGAGNIVFLLRVADHFRQAGRFDEMTKVIAFTSNAYGFHLDIPPDDEAGCMAIAARYSRRLDLMSDELLLEGYREPMKERNDPEDRPEPIQIEEMFDGE